jgi:hypothetical protein
MRAIDHTRRSLVVGAALSGLWPALARADDTRIEVPIRTLLNRHWTGVWIDGQGPYRFVLGSSSNLAQIEAIRATALALRRSPLARGVNSNTGQPADLYRAGAINIGGALQLTQVDFLQVDGDLGEGERLFDGTLPLMPDRRTAISAGAKTLVLGGREPLDGLYRALPTLTRQSPAGWLPAVEGKIGGRPVRLAINTASPYALTLYPDAVRRLDAWSWPGASYLRVREPSRSRVKGPDARSVRTDGKPVYGAQSGATPFRDSAFSRPDSTAPEDRSLQAPIELRILRGPALDLGGVVFPAPLMALEEPGGRHAAAYDGAIGMELLRRLDLVFDPDASRVWIKPNPAFDDPWRHDRAGFSLRSKDGTWRVARVDDGAPAAAAGLRVGDVVPGLDATGAANLDWIIGGAAGQPVAFDVDRDGQKVAIAFKLVDRV